eukprot:Em0205g6a
MTSTTSTLDAAAEDSFFDDDDHDDMQNESESLAHVPVGVQQTATCNWEQLVIDLVKKVDSYELTTKALAEKVAQLSSSKCGSSNASSRSRSTSSSGSERVSKHIPLKVKAEVRRIYSTLSQDVNFSGWNIGSGYKSVENVATLEKIVKEVQGVNPSFQESDIRAAAYRYYRTRAQQESLVKRGKDIERKQLRRKHERIVRKRKERELALVRNPKVKSEVKEKWMAVMKNEFMSSEDSTHDEGEDNDSIVVHPLPWRAESRLAPFLSTLPLFSAPYPFSQHLVPFLSALPLFSAPCLAFLNKGFLKLQKGFAVLEGSFVNGVETALKSLNFLKGKQGILDKLDAETLERLETEDEITGEIEQADIFKDNVAMTIIDLETALGEQENDAPSQAQTQDRNDEPPQENGAVTADLVLSSEPVVVRRTETSYD